LDNCDVIIIGGGVIGTAVARQLSHYKLSVVLLEKEAELAFGVSKSNSGIIHPGTQNPAGSLKGRLCVRGNALTRKIARELGVDFKMVGELIVAFSDEDIRRLAEIKREAELLGVRGLRIVGRAWLRRHEPNLSADVIAALYAPTAGVISPYRWVYDLAENAVKNGVRIVTNACVTGIERPSGPNGVFRVSSAAGDFYSAFLVNCAGLYADEIARMAGICDFSITPRKGEEFILDKKRGHMTNHLIFPLPTKTSKGVLIIKTSDGNPMIGPTAEDTDDKTDLSTSERGLDTVISSVRRMLPFIDRNDIIAYFAGLRPAAGDDFIIRHESSVPGLITVAGIQSPGLTAAPAIAEMAAGLLRSAGLRMKRKLLYHRYRRSPVHLFSIALSAIKRLIGRDPSYGDIVCRCEMVSAKEIRDAIASGAKTLDGIKFRTRCQAGRCHGSFCTTRAMKILAEETKQPLTAVTKRGGRSQVVVEDRADA
jgi:glycerol-3-phosphate dehydrogenase